jgi:hypothetical protein
LITRKAKEKFEECKTLNNNKQHNIIIKCNLSKAPVNKVPHLQKVAHQGISCHTLNKVSLKQSGSILAAQLTRREIRVSKWDIIRKTYNILAE